MPLRHRRRATGNTCKPLRQAGVASEAIGKGLLGMGAYIYTVRPVESTPIATVIATFGLLFIFQHVALLVFGPNPASIPLPINLDMSLMGRSYPVYRLFVAAAAMVIIAGLWLFLRRTDYGIWVRATQQDRITGVLPPTSGRILFRGEDITGLPVHRISQKGIARTVDVVLVEQNVKMALYVTHRVYILRKGQVTYEGQAQDCIDEVLLQHLGV